MNKEIIIYNEHEIPVIGKKLADSRDACRIFTFEGSLGAGKTTLVKEMLKQCGVSQLVTSPTFTYLNVYQNDKKELFYHFDLYRIARCEDFVAAGFAEYLYAPHGWTIIEWPAVVAPLLKEKVCLCLIDYYDEKRKITIIKPD
jgi:tRNA threonylcarbamoyladenosine biosynthesis protein TsaE